MEAAERLIRSTQELLWERGYVGTSPKAIQLAAEAGQGSMYHHFSGKAELAKAAIERSGAELRAAAEEQLSAPAAAGTATATGTASATGTATGAASATGRIAAYLRRDREVLKGCRMGRLTADPDVIADPALRAPVAETFEWLRARLAEVVAEGKESGEYPASLDPERTAATIAAVLQGGYVLARADGSDEPFELAVQGLVDLLKGVVQ